ncbi:uncharacterized protein LOC143275427 [Babylonia areolata]|uniref:uncharacterized protein LOC143275427 n=1 Tax=Babylonia areolata TaxID=304850 RepID=UPI003FD51F56
MSCFGCLGRAARRKEEKPLIVDVEQVIADEAWTMFRVSHGRCKRRFLRRDKFKIEVPMNYYHFEQDGAPDFKTKKRPSGATGAGAEPTTSKSRLEGRQLAHRDQTSPEHMGLETIFNNDTDKEQTYNFKFDKTRKASVTVSYQKGYSIGGKANFSLGLPKVLSDATLGMEMNMSVQVTKSTGETFEETFTTSANSQITVGKHSHYVASVVMEERSMLAEFEVNMLMTLPAKRAPVYIRDKSSGDLVFVYSVVNLPDVFENCPDVRRVKDEEGKVRADAVEFHIEGIVDGMQLSSHVINLSGRSLLPDNPQEDLQAKQGERDGGEKSP